MKDLITSFDNLKTVPSKLSKEERSFIKPMTDQAVVLRKLKGLAVPEGLFLESLLDGHLLLQMKKILDKAEVLI